MSFFLGMIDLTLAAAVLGIFCLYFLFEVARVLWNDKKRAKEIENTN